MGWCSGSAVCVLVVDGEGVAVDTVSDIDCNILGAHCARNYGHVRRVTSDGGRGDVVGCAVADIFGMGWCSGSAVGVLVVDGERVAVIAISDIDCDILGTHSARNDGQARCEACDGRRGDAV